MTLLKVGFANVHKLTLFMNHQPFVVESPLLIEKGTFTWGDEETILKNVSVQVDKQTLVAVVGGVGSGEFIYFVNLPAKLCVYNNKICRQEFSAISFPGRNGKNIGSSEYGW